MTYLYEYFFTSELGILEFIASVLTLICVYQCTKQSIWNFVTGGIAVVIFGYIFYSVQLYADATLQWLYYLPMSFYGWYYWMNKGPQKDTLEVRQMNSNEFLQASIIFIVGLPIIAYFYNSIEAAYPVADSYILVASILGQFWLSKKVIQNWILWISVDLVAVPVYFYKELYVTSGLYVILLTLASKGLYDWYKAVR